MGNADSAEVEKKIEQDALSQCKKLTQKQSNHFYTIKCCEYFMYSAVALLYIATLDLQSVR